MQGNLNRRLRPVVRQTFIPELIGEKKSAMASVIHQQFPDEEVASNTTAKEVAESITIDRTGTLISSEDLPSAAAAMAELFPPEKLPAEDSFDALPQESVEASRQSSTERSLVGLDEAPLAPSARTSPGDEEPSSQSETAEEQFIVSEESSFDAPEASRADTPASAASADESGLGDPPRVEALAAEGVTMFLLAELAADPTPAEQSSDGPRDGAAGATRDWSFEERLASHREWVVSQGATGVKIELAGVDLEGTELIGVNLRLADLHDANLKAADLLLADLRDASLVRANLQDSCLVGANLEGANLEGASLETAMGLVPSQLAGTNLHDAALPPAILAFEALAEFERESQTAFRFFVATASISLLSWLVIWKTRDLQLVANLSVIRFLHSAAAAAALPTAQFYLIAPVMVFVVYLLFHLHLQRLWDSVLKLPAVFPDGRALGEYEPRIVLGLLRAHFRWINQDAASNRLIEKAVSLLLAYWVIPFSLLLYWARYLTLQEIRGTILQEFLVVAATGMAVYATTRVGRPQKKWTLQKSRAHRIAQKLRQSTPAAMPIVLCGILTFLSAGTIAGVPHDKARAQQYRAASTRRWASSVLWSVGFDPYADLTESVLSTAPASWRGADDQVSSVQGARLNASNLRYAQAYGIFLANAHLWRADFEGAFLSAADLRGADLGQSNLQFAILDQAQMNHANLDRASLNGADLSRADLREANLSHCSLANSFLVDARLEGATLYGAQLTSATMVRAHLEKADLRESRLDGANLDHADLQQAYLWSAKLSGANLDNAQLGGAILVDSDLRGADLRGAQFSGTVLTGADLRGSDLDGADLRNASGVSANQVCSARSRRWVLVDDILQPQVEAQCGSAR
jgi:uncharacterized protein YjbI with pentapeptide repeats